jgi:hypothetical protein
MTCIYLANTNIHIELSSTDLIVCARMPSQGLPRVPSACASCTVRFGVNNLT